MERACSRESAGYANLLLCATSPTHGLSCCTWDPLPHSCRDAPARAAPAVTQRGGETKASLVPWDVGFLQY